MTWPRAAALRRLLLQDSRPADVGWVGRAADRYRPSCWARPPNSRMIPLPPPIPTVPHRRRRTQWWWRPPAVPMPPIWSCTERGRPASTEWSRGTTRLSWRCEAVLCRLPSRRCKVAGEALRRPSPHSVCLAAGQHLVEFSCSLCTCSLFPARALVGTHRHPLVCTCSHPLFSLSLFLSLKPGASQYQARSYHPTC